MNARIPPLPNAACARTEPTAALCDSCWDRPECLAWALENEISGFWAGHTQAELKKLRRDFGITCKPIMSFNEFAKAGS